MNARVEELFHQLADLSSEERARYVADHAVDEATREEVEKLLAYDGSPSARLEGPISVAAGLAFNQLEGTGTRCGPFRLLRVIGRGGMGVVWLAERADGEVHQQAAVKLLPMGAGDSLRDRFLQERQILASLSHPNIARMLDAGHLENGQPYLAMEYVDGEAIDAFADRIELRQRIELFLKVCTAVEHLHRNLIVHRDIKPGNVLVTKEGEPKLLDFGIAKLLALSTDRTVTAARMLTPDYASPEQVRGGPLTTATDVYSLAAMLYRMLTGKPAHQFESNAPEEILAVVTDREVTRPGKWAPELRGDLELILLKALKKDPQERYGTVERFAEDLARYLRNEPVTARPDSLAYRARKFVVRHRAGVSAATFALTALVAGTGIAVWQAQESARERDRALTDLRRAEATNDFSSYLLSRATPAEGKVISNAELLAQGEVLIATRYATDPGLRVHLLITLADRYYENNQFTERARVLKRAFEDSRTIADLGLRSYAACQWASQMAERGEFKAAFVMFDEVMALLPAKPEYASSEAQCRVLESIVALGGREHERSIRAAERAVSLEQQRPGAPGRTVEALAALGQAYAGVGRLQEANQKLELAIKMKESEGGANSREMSALLHSRAVMLYNAGQVLSSAPLSERAVGIARSVDGEHGASLSQLSVYASTLSDLGRYAAASRLFDESLAKARVSGSTARLVRVLISAADSAIESGDLNRAEKLHVEARKAIDADASASPILVGQLDLSRARLAIENGDHERGLELIKATEESVEALRTVIQMSLARALNAAGRSQEALPIAEAALKLWNGRLGGFKHSYWVGLALLEVASAKAGLGYSDGARQALALALEHTIATVGTEPWTTKRAEAVRRQLGAK